MANTFFDFTEEDLPTDPREQAFHNMVREYIIFLLILLTLYGFSYGVISAFKRKRDDCYADEEDALVYRISLWMCTFSSATSLGAALLLPFSIVTNEILRLYPDNYYMQWLNDSLVQGLWNNVFLFSNISLFILLPFAYFFTESEGFPGSRKGIMARVTETIVLLLLLAVLVLGITYLLCCVLGHEHLGLKNVLLMWHYLPFLYSCVSFLGVIFLLLCTPVGIAKLFTVLGELVVKPQFLRNVQEEYEIAALGEMHLRRLLVNSSDKHCPRPRSRSRSLPSLAMDAVEAEMQLTQRYVWPSVSKQPEPKSDETKDHPEIIELRGKLLVAEEKRKALEKQKRASAFRRNVGYPLAMLILVSLTAIAALLVAQNTLELLVGIKALPLSSAQQFSLGITSLSKIGLFGSTLEIVLILYLWCASIVGLYSLPLISRLCPKVNDTSFTQIIGNCALLLVLSSALPVLARSVGITNFDLLGEFGRIEWLGNFYVVLLYNLIFAATTAFSLTNHFTVAIRRELYKRFKKLANWFKFTSTDGQQVNYKISLNGGSPHVLSTSNNTVSSSTHSNHRHKYD